MADVFQTTNPPPSSPPGKCVLVYPLPLMRVAHTRWVERGVGGGVNILEDVRHSSVLYVCKYFVLCTQETGQISETGPRRPSVCESFQIPDMDFSITDPDPQNTEFTKN
jgi:hypothetical protein